MTQPLAEKVIRRIGQVAKLDHRLAVLAGPLVKVAHENLGQINIYVSWCRKNMMTDGANPPAGLLLRPRNTPPSPAWTPISSLPNTSSNSPASLWTKAHALLSGN